MQTLAKKKLTRQVVFRVPEEVGQLLDDLAPRFGQDISGFLRLILLEKLPEYKRRAVRMEQGEEEEQPR